MEVFRCEYSQMQLEFVMLTTITKLATFQVIFRIDKNEEICITWQNKDWTKVETTKDWDKIRKQVIEQPSLENNENFLQCLMMEIRRQMEGDDNTSKFCYRVLEFSCGNLGRHD